MSATITYKGSTLTTAENATRVLKTAGKYLEDDLTLVDVTAGGGGLVYVASLPVVEIPLSETDYATWTPSTTAKVILATDTIGTYTATNIAETPYFNRIRFYIDVVYIEGTTNAKGLFKKVLGENWYSMSRRPSNNANWESGTANGSIAEAVGNTWICQYYNSGWVVLANGAYGFYPSNTAPALSSSTAASPVVTVKRPVINAKCQATYFSTGMAAKVDQEKTIIKLVTDIYRVDGGYNRNEIYNSMIDMWHNGL